jgi:hypothetical protein
MTIVVMLLIAGTTATPLLTGTIIRGIPVDAALDVLLAVILVALFGLLGSNDLLVDIELSFRNELLVGAALTSMSRPRSYLN